MLSLFIGAHFDILVFSHSALCWLQGYPMSLFGQNSQSELWIFRFSSTIPQMETMSSIWMGQIRRKK